VRTASLTLPADWPDAVARVPASDPASKAAANARFADLLRQRRAATSCETAAKPAGRGDGDTAQAAPSPAANRVGKAQSGPATGQRHELADTAADDGGGKDGPAEATEVTTKPAEADKERKPAKSTTRGRDGSTDTAAGTGAPTTADATSRLPADAAPGKADGRTAAMAQGKSARVAEAPDGGSTAAAGEGQSPSSSTIDGGAATADVAMAAADDRATPTARETLPTTAGGPPASPARGAEAPGPASAAATLAAPLHAPDFAQLLAAQVSVFTRDGLEQAELHLNPPEMGPIGVQIELDGKDARISFHAVQAATRDVIERALPDLAAALSAQGLTLAGGGVFDRPADARAQPGRDATTRSATGDGDARSGPAAGPTGRALRLPAGMVDLYA
jgi:flagellar hook-length control protein FliK